MWSAAEKQKMLRISTRWLPGHQCCRQTWITCRKRLSAWKKKPRKQNRREIFPVRITLKICGWICWKMSVTGMMKQLRPWRKRSKMRFQKITVERKQPILSITSIRRSMSTASRSGKIICWLKQSLRNRKCPDWTGGDQWLPLNFQAGGLIWTCITIIFSTASMKLNSSSTRRTETCLRIFWAIPWAASWLKESVKAVNGSVICQSSWRTWILPWDWTLPCAGYRRQQKATVSFRPISWKGFSAVTVRF